MIFVFCLLVGFGSFLEPQEVVYKTPTIKEMGGFWYVYMEFNTTFDGATEKGLLFLDECRKQGIESNMILEVFHTWSEDKEALRRWDMAYIVPKDTKVTAPLKMTKLEKFKAVVYTHPGSFALNEIKESFRVVDEFMEKNGLKKIRPSYEIIYPEQQRMDIVSRVEK
jgi:hypothetical protein